MCDKTSFVYTIRCILLCAVLNANLIVGDSEVQRTMLELLNQLDGFEPKQNIKVYCH